MGLLKEIGKGIGKLWKGIKTGFKSVLGLVSKALSSKLGKVLMAAVSVFSLGTAFIAAQGAYAAASAAGQSFVGAFLEGGGAFVDSLLGKTAENAMPTGGGGKVMKNAGEMAEIAPTAEGALAGANAATEATSMGGALKGIGEAAKPAASNLGTGAGMMEGVGGVLKQGVGNLGAAGKMVSGGALPAAAEASGGWLSKAASAAMDFAKSDNGQNIIGKALEGYGRAEELDDRMKWAMRGPRSFAEGTPGMKALNAHDYNVEVPNNLAYRAADKASGVVSGHKTRVPYQQQGG
jgi:hypothetical protein